MQIFGLGIEWTFIPNMVDTILKRTSTTPTIPHELQNVEAMIGYKYNRKILMVEAMTHASYMADAHTVSYERLEFAGDAVLDMIVVEHLYRAPGKNYSPGQIQLIKAAVVNSHFLGYICLRTCLTTNTSMPKADRDGVISTIDTRQETSLWQCLQHSSPQILNESSRTIARYRANAEAIENALSCDTVFPFASLTALEIPKIFGDIIESLLGAVYLDSGGEIAAAIRMLEKLGIMGILRRIVEEDVDVLHPVSRLHVWANKHNQKLEFVETRADGKVKSTVVLDEEPLVYEEDVERGHSSKTQVRFMAAEKAIRQLRLRELDSSQAKL